MSTPVVKVVVKLKNGDVFTMENYISWDNFMAMLMSHRALVNHNLWVPIDSILSILPYVEQPVAQQTDAAPVAPEIMN